MLIFASHIYLYLDSNLPPENHKTSIKEFVNAGYSSSNIIKAKSILDVATQVKYGSVILVHSVKFCKSDLELLALLHLLQDKNITLRSILEPWLNIPIAEHMQSVAKIHKLISATFNDGNNDNY